MVLANRDEVERWLNEVPGAGFPTTRDDAVAALEHGGAPAAVVAAVQAIPPDTYSRPDQVAAAAEAVPDVTAEPTSGTAEQHVGEGGERPSEGRPDADRPPHSDEG